MWIVKLIRPPVENTFRDNFFPRTHYYKKDALALQKEIIARGGMATVTKMQSVKFQ